MLASPIHPVTVSHRTATSPRVEAARRRILLAEDDDAMRDMVATALRADGFDVIEARDAGELVDFVEVLTNARTDGLETVAAIVSDVRMPGMSGTDVVAALRNGGWAVPVVLVTAFGSPRVHERARALDAAILDKPFTIESLRALVQARIAQSHAGGDRARVARASYPSAPTERP